MEEKSIIELLFQKKDEEGGIELHNEKLKELDKEVSVLDDKITNYIAKRVHPKCRKKLNELIDDYTRATFKYYDKERGLIYETGFFDGMNTMLDALYNK